MVTGMYELLKNVKNEIFRSNEHIGKTKICDIKFVRGEIPYCFRDPQLISKKRDSKKTRHAYGVIGKWDGLEFGPYDLIRVSFSLEYYLF